MWISRQKHWQIWFNNRTYTTVRVLQFTQLHSWEGSMVFICHSFYPVTRNRPYFWRIQYFFLLEYNQQNKMSIDNMLPQTVYGSKVTQSNTQTKSTNAQRLSRSVRRSPVQAKLVAYIMLHNSLSFYQCIDIFFVCTWRCIINFSL